MDFNENRGFMQKEVCLVTGATGLLGSHLLMALLREGYRVKAVYRSALKIEVVRTLFACGNSGSDSLFDRVEWVQSDLTRFESLPALCEGVDRLFHVAGMVSFLQGQREALFLHNAEVTSALATAAQQSGVRQFVYVSSVATIDAPTGATTVESMRWDPSRSHSDYAESKHAAEEAVWKAAANGLKVLVVNPSVVLGPGFWDSGSGSFFPTVYKGLPAYPPGGTGVVDVRDVAEAMIALCRADCFGRRFILSGANVLYKELFHTIALSLGVSPPAFALRPWMANWGIAAANGYTWLTGRSLKISSDMIRSSFRISKYDGSAVTEAVSLRYTPLRDTLSHIAACYLKGNSLML